MRIVVIQDYLRPGGTEKHSVFLANFFEREGHASTLLTFRPGGRLSAQLQTPHARLQRLDTRLDRWAPFLGRKLRALQPQVVLLMGRAANEKLPRVRAAVPGVPVVATLRTGSQLTTEYRKALLQASAVVANSRWAMARAASLGVAQGSLHCINNGFGRHWNFAQHDSLRAHIRKEMGVGEDELVLIKIASFRKDRGQHRLLHTLASFGTAPAVKWRLWLLGEGPRMEEIQALAAELGLTGRINFLGFKSHTYEYLCGADVCVFASHHESQPNVLIEAQWAGLPVVCFDAGGVGECFLPGQSGYLIPEGDQAQFRERLGVLALNPQLRARMGELGHTYARTHFDTEGQARKYLELFARLSR